MAIIKLEPHLFIDGYYRIIFSRVKKVLQDRNPQAVRLSRIELLNFRSDITSHLNKLVKAKDGAIYCTEISYLKSRLVQLDGYLNDLQKITG